MTLEDAKKEIEQSRNYQDHFRPRHTDEDELDITARVETYTECLQILAKVETSEPDEQGRAVLWLIREHGIDVRYSKERNVWVRVLNDCDGIYLEDLTPSVLAKKLGWGG